MFKFFRRRAQPAVTPTGTRPPGIGGRVEMTSPADLKRATRFAADFKVTGPFVEPDSDEHELWKAGKLVPLYITHLLDAGRHVGPGVDAACHAEEPAVDRWEAGSQYPSWEQTVALARLLDVPVRDLTHPDAGPCHHEFRPRLRLPGVAILSFEPTAVQASTQSAGDGAVVSCDGWGDATAPDHGDT